MDAKERILEASARLFAQNGFSAVGVREIANEANVNISMISYYFNGKNGILLELMKEHFDELEKIVLEVKKNQFSQEEGLKELVRAIVKFIRSKHYRCKATLNEMPLDNPEIYQFKLKMFSNLIEIIKNNFSSAKPEQSNPVYDVIIGGSFISLLFSNFLFGDMLKKSYNLDYDDDFFEKYASIISTLFISGIMGVSKQLNQEYNNPRSIYE